MSKPADDPAVQSYLIETGLILMETITAKQLWELYGHGDAKLSSTTEASQTQRDDP